MPNFLVLAGNPVLDMGKVECFHADTPFEVTARIAEFSKPSRGWDSVYILYQLLKLPLSGRNWHMSARLVTHAGTKSDIFLTFRSPLEISIQNQEDFEGLLEVTKNLPQVTADGNLRFLFSLNPY